MTSTEYEHVPIGDVSENEDNRYRHFPEKLIIFPSNVLNTFGLLLPQEHISIKKKRENKIFIIVDHMLLSYLIIFSRPEFLNK